MPDEPEKEAYPEGGELICIPEDVWRAWNTRETPPDPHLEALEVYLGVLEYLQQQIGQLTAVHMKALYAAGREADLPVATIAQVTKQIREGREDEC